MNQEALQRPNEAREAADGPLHALRHAIQRWAALVARLIPAGGTLARWVAVALRHLVRLVARGAPSAGGSNGVGTNTNTTAAQGAYDTAAACTSTNSCADKGKKVERPSRRAPAPAMIFGDGANATAVPGASADQAGLPITTYSQSVPGLQVIHDLDHTELVVESLTAARIPNFSYPAASEQELVSAADASAGGRNGECPDTTAAQGAHDMAAACASTNSCADKTKQVDRSLPRAPGSAILGGGSNSTKGAQCQSHAKKKAKASESKWPLDEESFHLDTLFREHSDVDDVKLAYATFCLRRSQHLRSKSNLFELCHICFFNEGQKVKPLMKKKMKDHCDNDHKVRNYPCEETGCVIRTASRGDAGVHKLYMHEMRDKGWWKHLEEEHFIH